MRSSRLIKTYALFGRTLSKVRTFAEAEGFVEVLPSVEGVPGVHDAELNVSILGSSKRWTLPPCQTVPKQIAAAFLQNVYCVAPCYRDEGNSASHLGAFHQVEFESSGATLKRLTQLMRRFVAHMLACSDQKKQVPLAWRTVDLALTAAPIIERAAYDRLVARMCSESDGFLLLLHPPAFLQPANKRHRKSWAEGFELFMPGGHGELASGGVRERSFTRRLTNSWTGGNAPRIPRRSAGFGVGLERLVALLAGCHDLRELILPHSQTTTVQPRGRVA
jgi:aspartyl/asparaginyl-tRNA synthetase